MDKSKNKICGSENLMADFIQIRKGRQEDKQSILRLRNVVYPNIVINESLWDWQYAFNPNGYPNIWLALDGEEVVAYYAAIPHVLSVSGQYRIGYVVQNVMTHPEYQGMGIYNAISTKASRFLCSDKHPLNYTFPNQYSLNAFLRNGWIRAFKIPLLVNTKMEGCVRTHDNDSEKIDVVQVDSFDKNMDKFWFKIKDLFKFIISRNSRYLNWRYVEKPMGDYTLYIAREKNKNVGVLILKKFIENEGFIKTHIIDLLVLPDRNDVLRLLYSKALEFSIKQNSDELSYWLLECHTYFQICKDFDFKKKDIERYFVICVAKSIVELSEASNPINWHLSMGDSDVY